MNEQKDKKYVLGCDIGNGYGYVSLLTDDSKDPTPLFPNKYTLEDTGMPTTAYITPPDGKEIVVFKDGKPAEKYMISADSKYKNRSLQLVHAIKTRFKEGSVNVPNVNEPVPVGDIYSAIARDLLLLAEEELKAKSMHAIYDIVFTFPAAFSDNSALLEMMQKSIEKIEIDGNKINVLGRLPEPAAVAIDYLHYMQNIAPKEIRISKNEFTVLVYDLGHGTFDTAVVTARSDGTPYILHSKAGLPEVGGKNFDEVLYQEILNILNEQYGYIPSNEIERDNIRQEAKKAKIELTDNEICSLSIVNDDDYCDIEITRERFEELTEHLLLQTLELVQRVLDESLSAGIKIDCIVLSGGASQMPMVMNSLKELVEEKYPIVLYRPSEAVSFGAARFGFGISKEPQSIRSSNPISDPIKATEKDNANKNHASLTKRPNQVIEQLTDCCYGIWLPSEKKLEGEIEFVIQNGERRPATSNEVVFYSASSRVIVKVYRSKEKNKHLKSASIEECDSMLWVPFDVNPGSKCEVSITALENYGIEVELRSDNGEVYRKTTSNALSELV